LEDDVTYYFLARAFDQAGNESGDSNEMVYYGGENESPLAKAGPDQTVNEGDRVVLDGSGPFDAGTGPRDSDSDGDRFLDGI